MPEELRGLAPAKINLTLEVGETRPDGYHDLSSILQTLALADEVALRPASAPAMEVTGPFADGVPTDAANLAWRAVDALAEALGRDPEPLRIRIDKRIPAAGGLGGGASDAATVLRLLARRWPDVTEDALATAAAAVGSDEPFFLAGGTALAEGRGERVAPLPDLPEHGVVLFIPPDTLPNKTATLFRALDRDGQVDGATVSTALAKRLPVRVTGADLYNSFERVAFDCFPGLAELWEALEERTGEAIRLAGAGPTLFWIGPPDGAARVARAAAGLDCAGIATATAGSLWRR